MTYKRFDATFELFLANIALTRTQANNIDARVAEMMGFFYSALDDINIYLQGSYATGTTVKPLTENQGGPGEYDVDIVIESEKWTGAADALREIEELFGSDDEYKELVALEKKDSCVRLEFGEDRDTGVAFHVDVVPILNESGLKKVARRADDIWEESDSEALIAWTNSFFSKNAFAKATLLAVKRLRDVGGHTTNLTSILMLSLLKEYYIDSGSYFDDLVSFLNKVNIEFSKDLSSIEINNPINSAESLLKKWRKNPDDFLSLRQYLQFTYTTLQDNLSQGRTSGIREILSNDFPLDLQDENVDSMRSEGIQIDLSGKLMYESYIQAHAPNSRPGRNRFEILFFERSKEIEFTATKFENSQHILWQVNNARGQWEKRGNFFEAMSAGGGPGSSQNQAVNAETEQHLGSHWIRYIAVESGVAQVISRPFVVRVMHSALGGAPKIAR